LRGSSKVNKLSSEAETFLEGEHWTSYTERVESRGAGKRGVGVLPLLIESTERSKEQKEGQNARGGQGPIALREGEWTGRRSSLKKGRFSEGGRLLHRRSSDREGGKLNQEPAPRSAIVQSFISRRAMRPLGKGRTQTRSFPDMKLYDKRVYGRKKERRY